VGLKVIKDASSIFFGNVVFGGCAENRRGTDVVVILGTVLAALDLQSVMDLDLEHLNVGLCNSEVGHLNIQTVEVNAVD
jgi:hypothetical protein